jgi:hypothetical protein
LETNKQELAGCCITTMHHLTLLFHQGIFDQKQRDCHLPPTLLSSVFPIEKKLEDHHFDRIKVTEAESQIVLNTLTEHDFQDAFKKSQEHWDGTYMWKGAASRVMVGSGPKVSFWQDGSTSPGNYGWLLVVGWVTALQAEGHEFDSHWGHWIFQLTTPSSHTMALVLNQPLTEINTRNLPRDKGQPVHKAGDILTGIFELTV